MDITKDRISHYIERYDTRAELAENEWRTKGDHRYVCQRIEAEEIASALRIARDQFDDRRELATLKQVFGGIVDQAKQLMQFGVGSMDTIIKELVEVGRIYDLHGGKDV